MMQIEVLTNYRGRLTGEQMIARGVYDADDARLFGLARYLVDNGHARVIAAEMPVIEPVGVDIAGDAVEAQEAPVLSDSEAIEEAVDPTPRKRRNK